MTEPRRLPVSFAATGVANLASIMAAFRRAGAEPSLAATPEELAAADFAVVPGVGAFGSAMSALKASGMDEAIKDRITRSKPTMGVCAGMQVFFEASEESPGVAGMGIAPGTFRRFPSDLPVPQLGWNRVKPAGDDDARSGAERKSTADANSGSSNLSNAERRFLNNDERSSSGEARSASPGLVRQGWAYFANSYRLAEAPTGFITSLAEYGEPFVAALELDGRQGRLLLCQFHPELSGPWGLGIIRGWLGVSPGARLEASLDANGGLS